MTRPRWGPRLWSRWRCSSCTLLRLNCAASITSWFALALAQRGLSDGPIFSLFPATSWFQSHEVHSFSSRSQTTSSSWWSAYSPTPPAWFPVISFVWRAYFSSFTSDGLHAKSLICPLCLVTLPKARIVHDESPRLHTRAPIRRQASTGFEVRVVCLWALFSNTHLVAINALIIAVLSKKLAFQMFIFSQALFSVTVQTLDHNDHKTHPLCSHLLCNTF